MGFNRWDAGIEKHIAHLTDWFTDWIFCSAAKADSRICPVIFPFSRFFCDVERLENDPMESIGQGIVYTDVGSCHRTISDTEKDKLSERFYYSHLERLKTMLTPSSFLMDCHSFPQEISDVDICIGYNDDWSHPEDSLVNRVCSLFNSEGLSTGINEPFSNSISPAMPFSYPSMMIELNKRTYMTASGELDYDKAVAVMEMIGKVYSMILAG